MPARKFTDEQEQEICRRYLAGEVTVQLGEAFGCSSSLISRLLKRHGVNVRKGVEAQCGLTAADQLEILRRYQAGENTNQLARVFGVAHSTIGTAVKRNGGCMRTLKEAMTGRPKLGKRCFNGEQEKEVCSLYLSGQTPCEIGAHYGVTGTAIRSALKRNGIKFRGISDAKKGRKLNTYKIDQGEWVEVCRRYLDGENTYELGDAYGVSSACIASILERNGVARRDISTARGGLNDEQEAQACRLYLEGLSTVRLGEVFGVSASTIRNALERNGIERRPPGFCNDGVQQLIDNNGHHTHTRECEFYLFELARYSATHCKPGIAFDAGRRASSKDAQGEYGAEVLRLLLSSRAEAYLLEQAVLDATRGNADCPADLLDWAGATEVRAMPAEDMVPIVLRLAEELEELGIWEFAARYVPMTAAQRATCQQRALASIAA